MNYVAQELQVQRNRLTNLESKLVNIGSILRGETNG